MPLTDSQLPCLILGAGGHAKVLIEALHTAGREILGILTPDLEQGTSLLNIPVLGDDEAVNQYSADQVLLINGVGSLPGKDRRWRLAEECRNNKYQFGKVVHSNAVIASDVLLAEGAQLMSGVIIQPGCKIGIDTIINTGSSIDHDCVIGDRCHIAPGVTLSGDVIVGDDVHIGTGAQVIQGINIGDGSVIATGATVYRDVPKGMLVKQKAELIMEPRKS